MLMLKSSLVLLKLNSIDVGFVSNYYLEYWHFLKMTHIRNKHCLFTSPAQFVINNSLCANPLARRPGQVKLDSYK